VVHWGSAPRDFPLYRAPWESPRARELPRRLDFTPRPLGPAPRRVALQRQYWFGPVADFFITLGYVVLGHGTADHPSSAWIVEPLLETELRLIPRVFHPLQATWHSQGYPPLRARLLEAAEPQPAPK
jgi:hypothetical protein